MKEAEKTSYTLSQNVKPTKAAAYNIIAHALQSAMNDDNGQVALDRSDVESLYLYFAPVAPAKAKTAMEFLRKFLADKRDPRYYLQYIYVKDGKATATNGHIFARCDTDLEDGYYEASTMTKSNVDARFPNADRIVGNKPDNYSTFDMSELPIVPYAATGKGEKAGVAYQVEKDNVIAKYKKQHVDIIANKNSDIKIGFAVENTSKKIESQIMHVKQKIGDTDVECLVMPLRI